MTPDVVSETAPVAVLPPRRRAMSESTVDIPRIISVDDHVVEPPDLWTKRLPAKYRDKGPRVVRDRAKFSFAGGVFGYEKGVADGEWCDWWLYDELVYPFPKLSAAIGFDDLDVTPTTYDEIRPGCWIQSDRLADMTANHVEASVCFPNTLPRFCGQAFYERADKELALLCVRAYNDWMLDEWSAGDGRGRLLPLTIVPLWDAELAAAEVRRNAARGVRAVCFSEIPPHLGLPSIHSGAWDPFFAACADTSTVVAMHIGSSSRMPATSPDAPNAVAATLSFNNAMASMSDWLFSGKLIQFPTLTLAYSEGQIGWIPYILERADTVWQEHRAWGGVAETIPEPPSTYYYRQVYGCFFRDQHGIDALDKVGADNITFETDYPHTDSTWPNTKAVAEELMAGVPQDVVDKVMRTSAVRMLGL